MVKKIVKDPLFLAQKSVDATEVDKQVVTDLLDTLRANLDHCVGMAADIRRLRWITLTRALKSSMGNIPAGRHR